MVNPPVLSNTIPVVSTPCIDVCTLNPAGQCLGCFRTSDEIARWSALSEAERLTIMAELPARADEFFGD